MRRVAFLLIALLLTFILSGCGSPDQSVRMFLKYFIRQDAGAAKLYCTEDMDTRIDGGDFTLASLGFTSPTGTSVTWASVKGTISLFTEEETDDNAVVSMNTKFGDVTYKLKFERGLWKIYDIESIEEMELTAADIGEGLIEGLTGVLDEMASD
jgi:hypothetical protein